MRLPYAYIRSVIFGVEDSLVSTAGLVAGLSVGADNRQFVLLAGVMAVAIEALSMGAGEYLSDDAIQDLERREGHATNPPINGILMFASYLLAGGIPLAPIAWLPFPQSVWLSVVLALCGLFALGLVNARLVGGSPVRSGGKMLLVGGMATVLGVVVGLLFRV